MHFLWDFPKFQDTCTYFKGCQHDKLDLAVAYEFADVVGKYKKGLVDGSNFNDSKSDTQPTEEKVK